MLSMSFVCTVTKKLLEYLDDIILLTSLLQYRQMTFSVYLDDIILITSLLQYRQMTC